MAHFAKIEEGIVTQVVVVDNEHEANGEAYLDSLGLDGTWVQTSYNGNIRGKYAAIGDTYDESLDEFISPVIEAVEIISEPLAIEEAV
jgi:hypothetical protein